MFTRVKEISSAEKMKEKYPLKEELKKLKEKSDETIKAILRGEDKRFLLLVGPCSAHDEKAVLEYTERLYQISLRVKEKIFIVPRVYTNKPRSRGVGYKGMYLQPDLFHGADIEKGICEIRKMQIAVIENTGMFPADEMLFPENVEYTNDLISYYAIGARSVENESHRLIASGLDIAVGLKNPTSGNLSALVNSIYAAGQAQIFKHGDYEVITNGNDYAHAVLRGYVDKFGKDKPNYGEDYLLELMRMEWEEGIKYPAVIVDCNHCNSGKDCFKEVDIAKNILLERKKENSKFIKGLMIESFLKDGADPSGKEYGMSITDPCLGIEKTEKLINSIAEIL